MGAFDLGQRIELHRQRAEQASGESIEHPLHPLPKQRRSVLEKTEVGGEQAAIALGQGQWGEAGVRSQPQIRRKNPNPPLRGGIS